MNTKTAFSALLLPAALTALANQQPTSNSNPAYGNSTVQAQLRLNIRDNTEVVHFIRDTNDPKIITRTYLLKHADPYSIRPYLREMVQAQRVDYNNAAGRANTDYNNVYSKDNAAKTAKIFVPCGIECVKFADGTGMLLVSAEAYRFQNNPNGMGIDQLVAALDRPNIMNSSGQPKFIYFPVYRSAKELQHLVKNVGANVSNDTAELIGGKDKVEVDEELNCLFFNTALYSRKHIEAMLKLYDIPRPEVRLNCTVYELEAENDGMLGMDFQSWKNNDGVRFLGTDANLSRNYNVKDVLNAVRPDGTINTHYFNFEPKWNTRFLDFLVSKGHAKVVSTGTLAIQNNSTGTLKRSSGILYAELTKIKSQPGEGEHGNAVNVRPVNDKFKFELTVTPSITEKAAVLNVNAATRSLLGYTSTGAVRTSDYSTKQKIMLGTGKNRFYLGGIEKSQTVRDVGGVPLLKDLPLLGWLFSTERESTKKTQLVVVAECEVIHPDTRISQEDAGQIEVIRKSAAENKQFNSYGFRQFGLDSER